MTSYYWAASDPTAANRVHGVDDSEKCTPNRRPSIGNSSRAYCIGFLAEGRYHILLRGPVGLVLIMRGRSSICRRLISTVKLVRRKRLGSPPTSGEEVRYLRSTYKSSYSPICPAGNSTQQIHLGQPCPPETTPLNVIRNVATSSMTYDPAL